MRTIFVTRGLPASGKSTWAKDLLKKEPNRFKRVNRDDLRAMLDDHVWSKTNEDFVRSMQDQIVRHALADGFDVIMDNTHLVGSTVRKIHALAQEVGDVKVIEKAFNVSVKECLERNRLREGHARVPDKVINDMARLCGADKGRKMKDMEKYYEPRATSACVVEQDTSLPSAIICDLDGTAALIGDRSPYDASKCHLDLPNIPVVECVHAMVARGVKVIFMTGRDEKYREPSKAFIDKHFTMKYDLYMRPEKDVRKDTIVKGELFDAHVRGKFNVLFALDDRDQVCAQWRKMGMTCFQVQL